MSGTACPILGAGLERLGSIPGLSTDLLGDRGQRKQLVYCLLQNTLRVTDGSAIWREGVTVVLMGVGETWVTKEQVGETNKEEEQESGGEGRKW